jgi:hypothetical protein
MACKGTALLYFLLYYEIFWTRMTYIESVVIYKLLLTPGVLVRLLFTFISSLHSLCFTHLSYFVYFTITCNYSCGLSL